MRPTKFRALRRFGWQLDYRPDGWLPLDVRRGHAPGWHVLHLGVLGCITLGRVRPPRTVTVVLDLDASRYLEQMNQAAIAAREAQAERIYRDSIAYQRALGLAQVAKLLDDMCHDLGLDPVQVWRLPRACGERERRYIAEVLTDAPLVYWRLAITNDKPFFLGGMS